MSEVAGYRQSLEYRPFEAKWFYVVYLTCVVGAAALFWCASDLVEINIAAQVLNVFLLALVIGFLVALAVNDCRSRSACGDSILVFLGISAIVIAMGLFGGVSGLL